MVHWLGAGLGKFKTLAKGARRRTSPMAGKLDLFFLAEVQIQKSRKSDLHVLREVNVIKPYPDLRTQYLTVRAAAWFVRLIDHFVEPESPEPEVHDLLGRAFGYLERSGPNLAAVRHFERELGRCLGLRAHGGPATQGLEWDGKLAAERHELLDALREDHHDKPIKSD